MLNLDLLRVFICVAENSSFTRAASELNRSQSAISMQIKRLEEIVGAPVLVSVTVSRAFLRRAGTLDPAARAALVLVATSDSGDLAMLERAAHTLGIPIALLALCGAVISLTRRDAFSKILAIYGIVILVFHVAIPTSIEPRKIYQLVPVMCLLVLTPVDALIRVLPARPILRPIAAVRLLAPYDHFEQR